MTINRLLNQSMVDPMDDIARQARQGSVAAIIQVLNEKLADSGVRTRAVLADGILQLLCEAATVEQLDRSTLVDRIREILESLAPRNIRRVNINSRLVREQQLLWLEEISRDPANQLLWSQQITLAQPNIIKRLVQDVSDRQAQTAKGSLHQEASPRQLREQRQFWRGIMGGATFSILVLLLGWVGYQMLGTKLINLRETTSLGGSAQASPEPAAPLSSSSRAQASKDPFADAVRLAEQANREGKVAQSPADWLVVAAKWQQASQLMGLVSRQHPRYKTAQNRTALYRKNSESAQDEAERMRQQSDF